MIVTARAATVAALGLLAATIVTTAHATENSQVRALLGAPSYELTTPQFPGVYGQMWVQHYEGRKLRDDNGDEPTMNVTLPGVGAVPVKVDGSIRAKVLVPRVTWVTEQIVLDGRLGFSAAFPMVDQTTHVGLRAALPPGTPAQTVAAVNAALAQVAATRSGTHAGLADPEFAGFIDWQQDESRLVAGVAVNAPLGSYDRNRVVNTGSGHYWTVKPLLVASRVWENGFSAGLRATYSINTRNTDTDVRSGQYLHMDWSGTYRLNDFWQVGLQGYVLKQTTDDRGGVAGPNRVQALAAGPVVAYLSESGEWGVDVKAMQEFSVRNRPEGLITWVRLNFRIQ